MTIEKADSVRRQPLNLTLISAGCEAYGVSLRVTKTPSREAVSDSHVGQVTVERVEHNRVTFYRDGYQHPCVQPIERFMKEFREVAQ
jgi:hypothetical protein